MADEDNATAASTVEPTTEEANTETTMRETGTASAKTKTPAGPSKGTDSKDQTATEFVKSGESAKNFIDTDYDAKSGDELRKETGADDREAARRNLDNMAGGNSNHNTVAGVNPVAVAQADRPDYNPQRRPSSRANQQSAMGESPQMMATRVDAKKAAPTNAEIVGERRGEANEERDTPLTSNESPYMGEQ